MEEIDIWRSATTLITALGFTAAAFDASHRAKDLRDKGDDAGAAVWKQVEEKIGELKRSGYQPDATRPSPLSRQDGPRQPGRRHDTPHSQRGVSHDSGKGPVSSLRYAHAVSPGTRAAADREE